jgi:hypothetical protein
VQPHEVFCRRSTTFRIRRCLDWWGTAAARLNRAWVEGRTRFQMWVVAASED